MQKRGLELACTLHEDSPTRLAACQHRRRTGDHHADLPLSPPSKPPPCTDEKCHCALSAYGLYLSLGLDNVEQVRGAPGCPPPACACRPLGCPPLRRSRLLAAAPIAPSRRRAAAPAAPPRPPRLLCPVHPPRPHPPVHTHNLAGGRLQIRAEGGAHRGSGGASGEGRCYCGHQQGRAAAREEARRGLQRSGRHADAAAAAGRRGGFLRRSG